jgi:hypothetical protein
MHTADLLLYYNLFSQEKPSLLYESNPFPAVHCATGDRPLGLKGDWRVE